MMMHLQLHHQAPRARASRPSRGTRSLVKARAAAPPTAAAPPATPDAETAAAFARAVTGEWEGVTATFSPSGDALDLPDRYVPQAFRDWDMVPKDWQSQCSVPPLLEGGSPSAAAAGAPAAASPRSSPSSSLPVLRYSSRRMMPTVGCEADAVAFTDDAAVIGGAEQLLAAVAADGAYASAPARLPGDGRATVKLEACLPLPPRAPDAAAADAAASSSRRPERLRVVQTFTRDWTVRVEDDQQAPPPAAALLRLESVELHREHREGDFTGRVELLGCGGGAPPISGLERTPEAAAPSAAMAAAMSAPSSSSPPPASAPPGSLASPGVLTLLPLGAWSCVRREGGEAGAPVRLRAEAGVVFGRRRRVASFEFAADGALAGASIREEDV
jgi:hypothetical protein